MYARLTQRALGAAFATLILHGCGGGGGGEGASPSPPVAAPPPPPTATILQGSGVLTKFGAGFSSVTVNGLELNATDAALEVRVDDQPAQVSDLDLGSIVTVSASSSDGGSTFVATSIQQSRSVEGPVEAGSVDRDGGTFIVLGQTVIVTDATVFDDSLSPPSLDGIADGDLVEVHGLIDADGQVIATRIEAQGIGDSFEIVGIVSQHDAANLRFNIGRLVVDYSTASVRDFASGAPSDGDIVEVKGVEFTGDGALIATDVEGRRPGIGGADGDQAQIEGFVTRFVDAGDFDVAGMPVSASPQTEYERGAATDLELNALIEVEGTLDETGVLIATKIEFKTGADQMDVRIEAQVDQVAADTATVTVLGLTFVVDDGAMLEDKSDADLKDFNLADLSPGDYVRLRGLEDVAGGRGLVAVRLQREDFDSDTILQARVQGVAEPSFVLLGITIDTGPDTEFENVADQVISPGEFFAAIGSGILVKAKGTFSGGVLAARAVAMED